MSARAPILCEVSAPRAAHAAALAEAAGECARDLGQRLRVKTLAIGCSAREPVLTLHLPAELAASQHQVWCLACRLACKCPGARVSVHVRATLAFGPSGLQPHRRRCA